MQGSKIVIGTLVLVILGLLAYVIYDLVTMKTRETSHSAPVAPPTVAMQKFANVREGFEVPVAGEPVSQAEVPKPVPGVSQPTGMVAGLPSECYPRDVLTSADLLPADANSLWAQVNPSGQGSLADQNFLTAGFHIGINTVGQSLRNANRQLRSEPANPQVAVSPWLNSTIEPDLMRQPLEIGCGSP